MATATPSTTATTAQRRRMASDRQCSAGYGVMTFADFAGSPTWSFVGPEPVDDANYTQPWNDNWPPASFFVTRFRGNTYGPLSIFAAPDNGGAVDTAFAGKVTGAPLLQYDMFTHPPPLADITGNSGFDDVSGDVKQNHWWARRSQPLPLEADDSAPTMWNVKWDDYFWLFAVKEGTNGPSEYSPINGSAADLNGRDVNSRGQYNGFRSGMVCRVEWSPPSTGWWSIVAVGFDHVGSGADSDVLIFPNDNANHAAFDAKGFCAKCPPGKYDPGGAHPKTCVACPQDRYEDEYGQTYSQPGTACKPCPDGKFTDGQTGYSSNNPSVAGGCKDCEIGFSGIQGGGPGCVTCEKGKIGNPVANSGQKCIDCVPGRFNDEESTRNPRRIVTACKDCRRGFYTTVQAANSHSQCLMCPGGYYMDEDAAGATATQAGKPFCKSCVKGRFQPFGPAPGSGEYQTMADSEYELWSQDLMYKCADNLGDIIDQFSAGEKDLTQCQTECAKYISCKGIEYGSEGCVVRKARCGTWPDSDVSTKRFYARHQIRSCQQCPGGWYEQDTKSTGK